MANTKVSSEQIIDDVALGGNPTTTTQSAGNNTTRVATTAFVTTAVANLVDSGPGTLNTLNELAAALGDDANYAATITTALAGKQATLTAGTNINIEGTTISAVIGGGKPIPSKLETLGPYTVPLLLGVSVDGQSYKHPDADFQEKDVLHVI